jgi:hypothetical protein
MTPRVQHLLAQGITVAVHRYYGRTLTAREAELLARGGSIRLVLDRLAVRTRVRRAIPGHSLNDDVLQWRLAVAEVSADLSGALDGTQRRELISSLIERESSLRTAEEAREANARQLGEIFDEAQAHMSVYGRFGRYAYRLYSEQRATLELRVSDDVVRGDALERLATTYYRYLEKAARLPGATREKASAPVQQH